MNTKVVILSAFLSPLRSGAEACAEEVALALHGAFDITIVTARMRSDLPKQDLLQGKVPIVRVGFGTTFDKWLYPFLAPLAVAKLQPDTVHAVLETFAGLALAFCRAPKKILTCQTTNRSFLKGFIIKKPDVVTVISNVLVGMCAQLGRTDVLRIPNGVKLSAIRNALTKVEREQNTILFVGRLEHMKGVDTLLHAISILAKSHDVHVRIVGDGSKRTELEQLAKKLGIAGRTVFTGYRASGVLEEEYARAQIFCGLSRSEALGNVFLEAQASGCAVIGTSVGGIPDIITHEESGMLVAPNNPEAAADAMVRILTDETFYRRIRETGMAHAEQYDWKVIARKYAELY